MQTTIEKTFRVEASIEEAWAFLSDPNRVVTCVPGATLTEQVDDHNYKGAVSMKVGPVVTDFRGTITIDRLDEATHELELSGSGQDAKGKGSATMKMTGRLRALDDGGTEVTSSMEVNVVGKLAQFGARLFNDISNRMFEQFVDCFTDSLPASEPAAESAPASTTGEPAAPAASEAGAKATATPPKTQAQQQAAEPVKALPLLFQALGSSIGRLFRRLTGGTAEP